MLSSRVFRASLPLAVASLGLALAGCPNPAGSFDDFSERYEKVNAGTGGAGGSEECEPAEPGEIDGAYLFALSAKINVKKPILFLANLTSADVGGTTTFSLNLQPLDAKDRRTPVGPSISVGPFDVEPDGSFVAALPTLSVPGEANPISGSELEATINLLGGLCSPGDFLCGGVTGKVSKPVTIDDLTGSNFTMQRITDEAKYPDPVINCAGDPASAPPT